MTLQELSQNKLAKSTNALVDKLEEEYGRELSSI